MTWLWIGFISMVLLLLTLDLGVLSRKAETVSVRRAMVFTGFTVVLALAFAVGVYWMFQTDFQGISTSRPPLQPKSGSEAAAKFLNAWVIEYALSMDNILVIALIFRYFYIPPKYQHRVLFWGVLGALIMRGTMIGAGTILVQKFEWILYVFGVILLYTAFKLLFSDEESLDPDQTIAARVAKKLFPLSQELDGQKFFTMRAGFRQATPLFLVLVIIEGTDVIFAVDSIPAAFAITNDPFLIFTSNIFAILGLRSMYFALSAVIDRFRFLKMALVFVLAFVGVKMLIKYWDIKVPAELSLGIVVGLLTMGIGASWIIPHRKKAPEMPIEGELPVEEPDYNTAVISSQRAGPQAPQGAAPGELPDGSVRA